MKQLCKQGLRRCYGCKQIKELNATFFCTKKNGPLGFDYICVPCKSKIKRIQTRDKVLNILGLKCRHCSVVNEEKKFFDVDHIKPKRQRIRGGTSLKISEIDNYQVLCPNCHRLKTIAEGWH